MAWLAVDESGEEWIYEEEPIMKSVFFIYASDPVCLQLPLGSIEKLTGEKLTWDDKPIEI